MWLVGLRGQVYRYTLIKYKKLPDSMGETIAYFTMAAISGTRKQNKVAKMLACSTHCNYSLYLTKKLVVRPSQVAV